MSKKNSPGSGLTTNNKENTANVFQRFMRYFVPPASESANPYVREGVYTDPFDNPDSIQSQIKSMFTFSSPDDIAEDIRRKLDKKKETETGKVDPSKVPSFEDIMGIGFKDYLGEVAKIGEQAKNKDMLRSGISNLAYSPLIGSTAAMETAANISKLTGVNMAAIANQGDVMAQNPTKQKIAGRYFR